MGPKKVFFSVYSVDPFLSVYVIESWIPYATFHHLWCDGIASLENMQISNSRFCESSKCWVYSTVNHPWWMSMLFHRRGFCGLARSFVTFGGSGGMMTTARQELPNPCSPQAKTREESSRRGK